MAHEPVLSRIQQNDIVSAIKAARLEPVEFVWSSKKSKDGYTEVLTHPPTQGYIEFSHFSYGGFWVRWWPERHASVSYKSAQKWPEALAIVRNWLDAVAADHNAVDLWKEIAESQAIPGASDRPEYEVPFSPAELTTLATGLAEVEAFVLAQKPLNESQTAIVRGRFAYLLGAAKRGILKVDWLNLLVGQIVSLVTEGVLDGSLWHPVMSHAHKILNGIFQFGVRLLK